jgi:hypothetical protein
MAVAMFIRSPRLERPTYDRLVSMLDLDGDTPLGQLLHVAVEQDDEVECFELWQTGAAALAYVERRLTPVLAALRLGEPEVELAPLHNLFAPDLDAVGLIGGVSLPAHAAGAALRR